MDVCLGDWSSSCLLILSPPPPFVLDSKSQAYRVLHGRGRGVSAYQNFVFCFHFYELNNCYL